MKMISTNWCRPNKRKVGTLLLVVALAMANNLIHAQENRIVHSVGQENKTEYILVPALNNEPFYLPKFAIKTNLLYLATTSLNVAAEFALAPKWTFDASVVYNPFRLQKGGINQFWFVQPEARYWFCQRFERHFLGIHGIGGQFNIGNVAFLTETFEDHRYRGWGAGGGLSYGYHLPMGERWGWEFTLGVGYVYLEYDKFRCHGCDELLGRKNRHYVGPTKAGISLIYMIR